VHCRRLRPDFNVMELLGREAIALFPTHLFTGKLPDITVCDRAEKKLREMQKAGLGISEERAYVSPDDLQTLPEMKDLVDVIMKEAGHILNFYKVKRDSHYISNMWGNITHPNHRHHLHIHPNCLLSGLLYVAAPSHCGPTMFTDPRPGARMIEPQNTGTNVNNMSVYVVVPEKGRILIWPSFLPHAVENGKANVDEDRVVIAFNIMIRGTIETQTARLVLA
jgi:uncharacterized protein (TIGR02466 family)